ncbi:phage minor head protein [Conchiformibius steedae]|uniref:phage head morphogenesis protein n=1 Tax=Conchiformibius steedae TaxID=153493 RepID=UPI0026ECC993|nr:phage minor head protein [Conchiformibius steedae]
MKLNPLGLIDRAALEHLKSKQLLPSYSHWDVWLDQHAYAFTVAKMMDEDMLSTVRTALVDAIERGTDFRDFKARLKPYLMAQGWWGEQVMIDPWDGAAKTVQLGSTRRLKTIFETNLATAHAAGQWARIETDAAALPYLRYNPSAADHKRDSHKRYYGLVLPVQHPIWQQIFPPNGYGCQCSVSQLTRQQAERAGISSEPDIEMTEVTNPRTGEVVQVPADITPSFAHNHAKRTQAVLDLAAEKHGEVYQAGLARDLVDYMVNRGDVDYRLKDLFDRRPDIDPKLFDSSDSIIAEGKKLFEQYQDILQVAYENQQPHLGVMEVMRAEGVPLNANVKVWSENSAASSEFREAIRRYPRDWVEKANKAGKVILADDSQRAFQAFVGSEESIKYYAAQEYTKPFEKAFADKLVKQGDSLIIRGVKKTSLQRTSTHIHEYGHRLQRVLPKLQDMFERLWKERTADEAFARLRDMNPSVPYRDNEIGKRDDFPNEYYGKIYGTKDTPQPLEMLTMTFEALLGGNKVKFDELKSKIDFLYFGLALLTRYKP